jgi:ubiquinone/menaquinone biosynthesis C-methylase UbiE
VTDNNDGKVSLGERFKDYYKGNYDVFGNNINKAYLDPPAIDFEYNNFFKHCRISEMLVTHNVLNLETLRILDAGCGNGQDLRKMMELGIRPENCYGIDFNEDVVNFAKKNSPSAMSFAKSEMEAIPFEDSFFDLVFSFNTLTNHYDDDTIRKIISEIRRVIKDDGLLILILTLSDKPVLTQGVGGMPVRLFELNELKKLCEPFSMTRIANVSSCFMRPEGLILKDPENNPVSFDVLQNIYKDMIARKSYEQFYLNGALNHILSGLNIIDVPTKIIALCP